jgi:hypothetical protein
MSKVGQYLVLGGWMFWLPEVKGEIILNSLNIFFSCNEPPATTPDKLLLIMIYCELFFMYKEFGILQTQGAHLHPRL